MIRKYILGFIVWLVYRLLSWTWKIEIDEPAEMTAALKNKNPIILGHWHQDELVLVGLCKRYNIATIASTSKDGELMNTVIHLLGGKTSRGSSTRGGVQALKGLIGLVKSGRTCSFAVDGPKGPIYKVKPGIFEVSRLLKSPIFVSGVVCDRAIHFPRAWNKTYLPKPFAKIHVHWSGPWGPATKETDPRNPQIAQELEDLLHSANKYALKVFAANDP